MFLELFLFAKEMKLFSKGGIHCISRSYRGTFILGHSLVDLTEHDESAADTMVLYVLQYCTAFIVRNDDRYRCGHTYTYHGCICKDTPFLCSADHEKVWQPYAVDP